MQITLYNFKKRTNSCKQPASDAGTSVTCVLKDNCSIFNPVFELSKQYAEYEINYVKWGTRYYFVSDIIYESNSICLLQCQSDVLASWRNAIGNSSQYVLRSASQYDGRIVDTLYPAKTNATPLGTFLTDMPSPTMTSGYYVIGFILGGDDPDVSFSGGIRRGSITYFIFSIAQTNKLVSQFSDRAAQFLKLKSPFEYITSCIYIPFNIGTASTVTTNITLGSEWQLSIQHLTLSNVTDGIFQSPVYEESIQGHSQSFSRGEYLNHAPYLTMTLYGGPFGVQTLDTHSIYFNAESSAYYAPFYYRYSIDMPTGIGRFEWSQHDQYIESPSMARDTDIYISNVGISVNLTSMTWGNFKDLLAAGTSLAGAFASAGQAAFNGGSPINDSSAAAIGDVLNLISDHIYSKGATGTMIDVYKPCIIIIERTVVDDDNDDRGRPLCQVKKINTLSGYILCADADIDFAGTMQEIDAVKNYMNTGFFYE